MPRHGKPESMLPFDEKLGFTCCPNSQHPRAFDLSLSLSLASRYEKSSTPPTPPHTAAFPEVSHRVEACMATKGVWPDSLTPRERRSREGASGSVALAGCSVGVVHCTALHTQLHCTAKEAIRQQTTSTWLGQVSWG